MLQQALLAMALTCPPIAHTPRADVLHTPAAPTAGVLPADVQPPLSFDLSTIRVPLAVDVLRGQGTARAPLVGELPLGSFVITSQGVAFEDSRGVQTLAPTCLPQAGSRVTIGAVPEPRAKSPVRPAQPKPR
jgi:hypothetical protein